MATQKRYVATKLNNNNQTVIIEKAPKGIRGLLLADAKENANRMLVRELEQQQWELKRLQARIKATQENITAIQNMAENDTKAQN